MSKGKIVNCFYDGSESGFGDFLRGSIYLYGFCKHLGVDFDIDLSHHPIKKYFNIKDGGFDKTKINDLCVKVKKEFGTFKFAQNLNREVFKIVSLSEKDKTNYIFSHFNNYCLLLGRRVIEQINQSPPINIDCAKWFKKKLKFSDAISSATKEVCAGKPFNIIHFRLGDALSFYSSDSDNYVPSFNECLKICQECYYDFNEKLPLVIISDNNDLKSYLKRNKKDLPLIIPHTQSCHTQEKPSGCEDFNAEVTNEGLFHAVLDMKLVSLAKEGKSFSVYDHGSGFFTWICKIYNVPFCLTKFAKESIINS